jgi:DNA-binding NarL/FixJ family response regulator
MDTNTNREIRILLVDDHELILNGLKFMFEEERDIKIIGTAKNGLEAISILQREAIDLLLTDIKMPEMNGLELARYTKAKFPDIKIIALTLYKDPEFVRAIVEVEADGYILKNEETEEIKSIIRHVMNDGTHYSREIVNILKNELSKASTKAMHLADLSKRELEIVKLICQELSSVEIAEKLFISKATVDVHRKNIVQKLGVKSVVGLIRFALENGIVDSL